MQLTNFDTCNSSTDIWLVMDELFQCTCNEQVSNISVSLLNLIKNYLMKITLSDVDLTKHM